ncbi:MAG: tetratricopeptide repeat protein [Acidobacteriota bacterium]
MASGHPDKAVPIYERLVHALPGNPGLIMNLGIALEMSGHDRAATNQFITVLKLNPQSLSARLFLGLAYLDLGQSQDAIGQLRKVVAGQPKNELVRWKLGDAYFSLGKYAAAEREFQALCKLNPRNPKGWYGLGRCYFSLWFSTVQKLRHIAPDSGYALALLAGTYSRHRQYATAVQLYRKAMAKLPALPGLHAAVAEIYKTTGHPEWAAVEEKKERLIAPTVCKTDQLACDYREGRYDELLASASHKVSAESYYWESKAYLRKSTAAYAHLSELPPSAEFHEITAKVDLAQGEFRKCVKEWQEALRLSPNDPEIEKNLAIAYKSFGDQENARKILARLVTRRPEDSDVNYLFGDTLLSLHQPSQAIPFLKKAVRLNPSLLPAQGSLAKAYFETGQAKQAIPHFKAALSIDRDGSLHYELARAYQQEGQIALAEQMVKRFQKIRQAQAQPQKSPPLEPPTPLP